MQVKGVALVSTIAYIKTKHGEEGFEKVLNKLAEEDREILSEPIMEPIWYPFRLYVNLTQTVDQVFGIGDLSLAREVGAFGADHDLKTIYKIFYKLGSPQFIIKQVARVFSSYFDVGNAIVIKSESKSCVVELHDFPALSSVFIQRVRGFTKKTIELSGGKNVRVHPIEEIRASKKIVTYNVFWE